MRRRSALVDLVASTDGEALDGDDVVVDEGEDAVGAYAIAPFARMIRGERFAEGARVQGSVEVVLDPGGEDPGVEPVHLGQLFTCSCRQLDAVPEWAEPSSVEFVEDFVDAEALAGVLCDGLAQLLEVVGVLDLLQDGGTGEVGDGDALEVGELADELGVLLVHADCHSAHGFSLRP